VPPEERLWVDDRGKAPQSIPSEHLRFGSQPTALVVGESGLSAQLFLEHLHFLLEVFDDELLVAIEPTADAEEQELERVHRLILPNRFCSFESRLVPLLPCPLTRQP
jgi:hypothetical protein